MLAATFAGKIDLLKEIDAYARALDPRVIQVMAGLAGEYDVILVARADGIDIATGNGVLRVLAVQRAGGRRIEVRDWLNARPDLRGNA